ncbi:MAG: tRNA (adenosine(37)-N6)-dimethylallyltransferase MiaA [Chloroflexia bacterium]
MRGSADQLVITIIGPTASGKSALAIKVAEAVRGEIVTADSRQVYHYMDIGTDKPPAELQRRVRHHMIDLVDPDEAYTLAMYQDGAGQVIPEVWARGRVPILAGGTPLYVNAVIEGWFLPRVEPDLQLRGDLEREVAEYGPDALHARLAALDPPAAEKILPTNARRIIRALEVIAVTGRPISEQQGKSASPPFRNLLIGLKCERQELYRRIDDRVDREIASGLVEEVAGLHERGYSFDLRSMSGLGYRQIGEYLLGRATLEEARQRIKWDTHAFARHQANWFRRAHDAIWLEVTASDPAPEALELVDRFLQGELKEH